MLQKCRVKILRVLLSAILVIVLGLISLPMVAATEAGPLKVVMDDNYPPYVFRDAQGKLVGILIDQWALWEKETGVKAEITAKDWADAQSEMRAGQYDVIDTIFKNPERELLYDYSNPYTRLDTVVFFNKNLSGITGIESLKGFNVGVKRGDHSISVLKQAGISNIVEYSSYESMILAARDNSLLVFIMEKPPGLYYLFKNGLKDEIRFSQPIYHGEFHRAVRKGNIETLQLVESGFAQIGSAAYRDIDRKWFGDSSSISSVDYRMWVAVFGIVLFISAMLLFWNWLLRQAVNRKTKALVESEKKFRELLMNLAIGVIVHDVFGKPTYWNMSALQQSGLTGGQLAGKDPFPTGWEYIDDKGIRLNAAAFPARIVLSTGIALREYTVGIKHFDSKIRWFQVDAFPDFGALGKIEQVVVTFFDITTRRESEERLRFISFHDALTGVYNRAYFEEELRRLDGRHEGAVAIAIADVDGMKLANDTWGHIKGDELLIRAAAVLCRSVRNEDVVARIGGDEFAVILRNADETSVKQIFDRLQQILNEQERRQSSNIPVRLSVGYAFAAGPGVSSIDLFKTADDRMYQEKIQRRGNRR
jgi:diguanylate cyclase (GGDEF)-like protein/PAS domain S-box-containing protein